MIVAHSASEVTLVLTPLGPYLKLFPECDEELTAECQAVVRYGCEMQVTYFLVAPLLQSIDHMVRTAVDLA